MHSQYNPGFANTVEDSLTSALLQSNKPNAVLQGAEELPKFEDTKNSKNLIEEHLRGDKDLNDLINYLWIGHYLWMDKQQGMW